MKQGEIYRAIASHIFEAFSKGDIEKVHIILADSQEEAEAKIGKMLGLSSPIVRRVIATDDPQVYEI